jgi:hypothetical protein
MLLCRSDRVHTIERLVSGVAVVGMNVRGNNIDCSDERMETELQGCYILHVCAKELLAESERAISATVPHGRGLRQLSTLTVLYRSKK